MRLEAIMWWGTGRGGASAKVGAAPGTERSHAGVAQW
jgi:hypothetical protein